MVLEILRWWLTVELLGLAAAPLALAIFRRLPDRGYSFAKPLGILLVSYIAWLIAMVGLAPFSAISLLAAALFVGGVGIWAAHRARVDYRRLLRNNFHAIAFHELLFAVMLFVGLVLRWRGIYGAQINHTETPMDFAFLNGILASREFPPQDPWLAHYPINYYYFGYLMVAALTRLSGLASAVTFNLAGATIYALAATGVAGIVWNLIAIDQDEPAASDNIAPVKGGRKLAGRVLCCLAAVVLVLVAGNQVAALEWLTRSERVVALRGSEVITALRQAGGEGPIELARPLPAMPSEDGWGDRRELPVAASRRAAVSWWWPSRAVWDDLPDGAGKVSRTYTITEFPFFSFILGDLHPHVLSLPWTLLAVALALNLLLRPAAPEWIHGSLGRVELLVTAIGLGGLYAINSWDLPTYLLLYLGALLLLYLRLAPAPGQVVWAHLVQQAGVLLAACWIVWLPFHMSFVSLVGGNGSPLGLTRSHTPLVQFVIVFGLFAVPLLALVLHSASRRNAGRWSESILAVLAGLALMAAGIVLKFPLLFLLPLGLASSVLAYRAVGRPARAFALWGAALGAFVVFGTEVVYLRDVFEGQMPRMNTLFKFYYQVWLLWGMLAGYALYVLLRRPRLATGFWLAPFGVLLLGSLVYPVLVPRRGPVDRTLDGTAYIRSERPADAAGIAWVRANVPSDAIVLEAPSEGSYDPKYSRISTATGRPTLIGWRGHEDQWRGGEPEVRAKLSKIFDDAATIYTTADGDQARQLIDQYGIAYVYVGPVEQQFAAAKGAPPEALNKFGSFMDRAWSSQGVTIYKRREAEAGFRSR